MDPLWQGIKDLRHRIPAFRNTEPMTLFNAIEHEKLSLAWASDTLTRADWAWDAKRRKAKRTDTSNRPREFLTHVVLALYDERHPTWCEREGRDDVNPQGLREEIGWALRWFFPPPALVSGKGKPIHHAIHNNRLKRRRP